ncbi:putative disease resistance protein At3g14460 [Cornus florida]|uniref:putative disease resistance protein At3g14460 n=1 Tax=Cornus florida TaxID=4283 RepID=UPI002897AC83|nr:putative disease resistance protein At3g14460 [Cornus florida]
MSSIPAVPTYHLQKLSHDECRSMFAQYALGSTNFDAHLNLKEIGDKIVKKCNVLPLAVMTLVGLLQLNKEKMRLEDFGKECFDDLLSRSFFQRSSDNKERFVMHDLINDLAQFVAGEICFRANDNFDGNEQSTISKRTRHLISELPNFVCNLKHLRYLNLSYTLIQRLPESLGTLYNLQILSLRNCTSLRTLPLSIINLINLRHLDNANTELLEEMPLGIGKLTNLQTLSKIIVGKSNRSRLSELKNLLHLCGKLSILKLENVTDVGEAMEANLMGMKDLDELKLGWSEDFDGSRSEELEMHALDTLKPQRKLKKLKVEFYRGASFPTWMMGNPTFSEMMNLSLSGCTKCESLPPLGQLPLLKDLLIRGMYGVKSIGAEFCKYDYPLESPFPSLESLTFEDMPELEECLKVERVKGLCILPDEVVQFLVALEKLEFNERDQLLTPWENGLTLGEEETLLLVPFCKLESLKISECANLEKLPNGLNNLKSLTLLFVSGCSKLVRFPEKGLPPLLGWLWLIDCEDLRWCLTEDTFPTTLKYINIINCMELEWVSETMVHDENSISSNMSSLQGLSIHNWPNMGRLVGCVNHFATLLALDIWDCDSLECFPERGGLSSITNLTRLSIGSCVNLRSLPPFDQIQNLTYLFLYDCPNLELFGNWNRNGNLPPKLVTISVDGDYGKPSLSEWGLHRLTSLQTFSIYGGFSEMICFPDEALCVFPASLTELSIQGLSNVECISSKGFQNPTSLQHLDFYNCPNLGSLPMDVLASTLQSLKIRDCPNLKKRCKKEREDYWPMIVDIPCVKIDAHYNIYE